MPSYERELEIGCDIARAAGKVALQYGKDGIAYDSKSDESPVTVADKECERLIVAEIERHFPEDGLLGEEGAMKESRNGRKWIIDPIDGTRDFIRGTRAWSVLIGLEEHDRVVAGFAYFPALDELFYAAQDTGAWWTLPGAVDPVRIRVSKIDKLSEALVCVNGLAFIDRNPVLSKRINPWMAGTWGVRSMGGCLDAMLVCSGRADLWIEVKAAPWDLAPLKIIAQEAGAVTFDFAGRDTIYGGNFAMAVPPLADELKRFLACREEEA